MIKDFRTWMENLRISTQAAFEIIAKHKFD